MLILQNDKIQTIQISAIFLFLVFFNKFICIFLQNF